MKIVKPDEPKVEPRPIRCLVIQLAQLGDLFQSLMALRAVKQLYPQVEIHLLTREKNAVPAKRVGWISSVITMPEMENLKEVAGWVRPLVESPWDMVLNWTYSESSSYLNGLLPARIKLGYSRRKDLSFSSVDGWSHYIQAVVQAGIRQNIHLTDILTTQFLTALQIHAGEPQDPGNTTVTSRDFFNLEAADVPRLQMDPLKRWLAVHVQTDGVDGKLIEMILRRHPEIRIALLGEDNEGTRTSAIIDHLKKSRSDWDRVLTLTGDLRFDRTALVLSRCEWLISNDSPLVHLASLLGTKVLCAARTQSRVSETGPYGTGHYIIQHADKISTEALYASWSYAQSEWSHQLQIPLREHLFSLGYLTHFEGHDLLRSRIRRSNDGGGIVYESLIEQPITAQEWTSRVVGHLARAWYCGWLPELGSELKRTHIHPNLLKRLREVDEALVVIEKLLSEAHSTSTAIHTFSLELKSEKIMDLAKRTKLKEMGEKMRSLNELVERAAATAPELEIFSSMSKVLLHNLQGEMLSELGLETAEAYQQLRQGSELMREWVKYTLKMGRPQALRSISQERSESEVVDLRD